MSNATFQGFTMGATRWRESAALGPLIVRYVRQNPGCSINRLYREYGKHSSRTAIRNVTIRLCASGILSYRIVRRPGGELDEQNSPVAILLCFNRECEGEP